MKILEVSSKGGFEKFVKKCGMRRIAGAISTALEGDCMGQDVRSSVPVNKKLTSSPLMYALLTENSPDYSSTRYFKKTQSTLPEKNTANNKHDASSQVKQVKSLPRFLHGQHTKAQILDHSGRTYCQPLFSLSSLRCQMASECPTDDQIRDFIEKRLARYTNASTPQSRNYASITTSEDNGESSLQYNSVTPHPTSVSEEYVERQGVKFSEIQQYSVATGQALKDDSSKFTEANVPLTPKSTVASKKQTEYPQILVNVAGTCTRNEDESPVVLTAVPPVILDELTKKHLSSSQFNCGLSYEEYNSPFSNMSKNLDVMNRESDFSQKRDIDPKSVEPIDLNKVQDVTDVSEEFQSDPSLKTPSESSKCLKLAKDSKGTFGKDKTQPLKTSTATHKKGDSLDLDKTDKRNKSRHLKGTKEVCGQRFQVVREAIVVKAIQQ
ncbi:hypothetical protein Q5P01_003292 [Channa striata]|uniref:Uncharacterized protein n=1 Tax=Channa striata TaxID=64152 RepID=A0AA88NJF7_CHASR|nr:hypothetical protein Q5P01_003292 [Channa striata]